MQCSLVIINTEFQLCITDSFYSLKKDQYLLFYHIWCQKWDRFVRGATRPTGRNIERYWLNIESLQVGCMTTRSGKQYGQHEENDYTKPKETESRMSESVELGQLLQPLIKDRQTREREIAEERQRREEEFQEERVRREEETRLREEQMRQQFELLRGLVEGVSRKPPIRVEPQPAREPEQIE